MSEDLASAAANKVILHVASDTVNERLGRALKIWPHDYRIYLISGVLIAAMLGYASFNGWDKIKFNEHASIPGIFGFMLLVSLFVERMIEVFVSVWVDRASAIHEQNLAFWQARQGQMTKEVQALIAERNGSPPPDATRMQVIDSLLASKRTAIDEAVGFADAESKALLPFKVRTLKVSTWIGLLIGVMTSAVGFRFLGQLVTFDSGFESTPQGIAFLGADILLTGAVLAGGSKLIHDMLSVYSSFMDSTKSSLSDQSKNQ